MTWYRKVRSIEEKSQKGKRGICFAKNDGTRQLPTGAGHCPWGMLGCFKMHFHPLIQAIVNFITKISAVKVVLGGYPRCPDSHDLSECHHLYDLGKHILTLRSLLTAKYLLPPIRLTGLTWTPKKFL